MNKILPKIQQIISEQMCISESEIIGEASLFDDFGMDSLDSIELVMSLEEDFGIDIPDEDIEGIETVSDIVKYIEKRKEKTQ